MIVLQLFAIRYAFQICVLNLCKFKCKIACINWNNLYPFILGAGTPSTLSLIFIGLACFISITTCVPWSCRWVKLDRLLQLRHYLLCCIILNFLLQKDLEYWQIDELILEPCCALKYYPEIELCVKEQKGEQEAKAKETQRLKDENFGTSRWGKIRTFLWNVMEYPETSRTAQVMSCKMRQTNQLWSRMRKATIHSDSYFPTATSFLSKIFHRKIFYAQFAENYFWLKVFKIFQAINCLMQQATKLKRISV